MVRLKVPSCLCIVAALACVGALAFEIYRGNLTVAVVACWSVAFTLALGPVLKRRNEAKTAAGHHATGSPVPDLKPTQVAVDPDKDRGLLAATSALVIALQLFNREDAYSIALFVMLFVMNAVPFALSKRRKYAERRAVGAR